MDILQEREYWGDIRSAIDDAIKEAGELDLLRGYVTDEQMAEHGHLRIEGANQTFIRFTFNEVIVMVGADSVPDLIYRDWQRVIMGWRINTEDRHVGPYPNTALPLDEAEHQAKVKEEQEARALERSKQYEEQQRVAAKTLEEELASAPEFVCKDIDAEGRWETAVSVNTDPYGKCTVDYARDWARLMQRDIDQGKTLIDVAKQCSNAADKGKGITGFMYGCAVSILADVWVHGEELRKWHNKGYGVSEESTGVVNPAIMSFG
jgi:hypothetical protein